MGRMRLKDRKVEIRGKMGNIPTIIKGVISKNPPREDNVVIRTDIGNEIKYNRKRLIRSLKGER
jgi:hypothetical protein